MKFGKVSHPEHIDFSFPEDHPHTSDVLAKLRDGAAAFPPNVYVGCAKWNGQDLKNFYPKGVKNELAYYATQFNSIELNATFYRNFPAWQFEKWYDTVPQQFVFFPKVHQNISHVKRLLEVDVLLDEFLSGVIHLKEKLGTVFLQMSESFSPRDFNRLVHFVARWPKELALAVELRHAHWFNNPSVTEALFAFLQERGITLVLVDTPGRRDVLHTRLTTGEAFVRFVTANHPTDYGRMDDWVLRLRRWSEQGLTQISFFLHQDMSMGGALRAPYFVEKLNKALGINLKIPRTLSPEDGLLF